MSRDIRNFNNGLDVDGTVDRLKAGGGSEVIEGFFRDAQNAEFIVPYREDPNQIQLLKLPDKGNMLPIFSSFEAFQKSHLPEEKTILMTFSKANIIVKAAKEKVEGIVVNPHGKSLIFQKQDTPEGEEEKNVSLPRFAALSAPMTEVTEALTRAFCENGKIYKAFLLQSQTKADPQTHPFLIVDFDGDAETFFANLKNDVDPAILAKNKIEMTKADFKLLSMAEKIAKPFYKKR